MSTHAEDYVRYTGYATNAVGPTAKVYATLAQAAATMHLAETVARVTEPKPQKDKEPDDFPRGRSTW